MIKEYSVDVFSKHKDYANRCKVFLFSQKISKQRMQLIAMDNKFSECAFILDCTSHHSLRIFSPKQEMKSCTHATLASLYIFNHFLSERNTSLYFNNERLSCEIAGNNIKIPIQIINRQDINPIIYRPMQLNVFLNADLWCTKTASGSKRLMIRFQSLKEVMQIEAETIFFIDSEIPSVESYFVYCSMDNSEQVFYGRMFAPKLGIKEDPVNGNSCIALFSQQLFKRPDLTKVEFIQNKGAHLTIGKSAGRFVLKTQCFIVD